MIDGIVELSTLRSVVSLAHLFSSFEHNIDSPNILCQRFNRIGMMCDLILEFSLGIVTGISAVSVLRK